MKPDTKFHTNFHTKITAGESKIDIVLPFSDGPGSISLAWGTFVMNLGTAVARVLRGIASKLWYV